MNDVFSSKVQNFKRKLVEDIFNLLSQEQKENFVCSYGQANQIPEYKAHTAFCDCQRLLSYKKQG